MSIPNTVEGNLLRSSEQILAEYCGVGPHASELRFEVLEHTAAILGRFNYDLVFQGSGRRPGDNAKRVATDLASVLTKLPYHGSLGLAAIARPDVTDAQRRKSGAYYTDFRLAIFLAGLVRAKPSHLGPILDPACGSAILLVATVLKLSSGKKNIIQKMLKECICGADLSAAALRGAFLSLASLTDDIGALRKLRSRLRRADSLLSGLETWEDVAPNGFGLVIGNPPWEKLKITRHEWLLHRGEDRHYGEDYPRCAHDKELIKAREDLSKYVSIIGEKFLLQGRGEYDLFKLFCELSFKLTAPSGELALLVPAGLIRSQGTRELRQWLMDYTDDVEIAVIENRARFFEIDTRFKFLAIRGSLKSKATDTVTLLQTVTTSNAVSTRQSVCIPKGLLRKIRPDFSIPEVRSAEEWKLFLDLCQHGNAFGDPSGPWEPSFMREVDMTKEKGHFLRDDQGLSCIPLIEGRMVHQYRYAAKRYMGGTGRRSIWQPTEFDDPTTIQPQFRFPNKALPHGVTERVSRWRVGFCDITGQTNERTMLAARIPAGVVCGNKVPTIVFDGAPDDESLAYCWLAIANSFVFDWLLRRVVTTTVNYFLLEDLPFPKFDPLASQEGRRLAFLSKRLSEDRALAQWDKAEMRAEIETLVLGLFGRDTKAMEIIMRDFPLLDRAQPTMAKEDRSSITKDLVLLRTAERLNGVPQAKVDCWQERVQCARSLGAIPFVPSHLASDYE
jgi:hypothetical protein